MGGKRWLVAALASLMVAGAWIGPVRGPQGVVLAGPPLVDAAELPRPGRVLLGNEAWEALYFCESSRNPRAIGGGGRFYGAFQFTLDSWRWVGMHGNPIDHPYEVQLIAARRLHKRQGWKAWPVCARKLGLLR